MPKRSREESKEEKWSRKMKKYEQKLALKRTKKCARIVYSDEESDVQIEEHPAYDMMPLVDEIQMGNEYSGPRAPLNECIQSSTADVAACVSEIESIHEEADADSFDPQLLQALGDVEVDTVDFGEDIHKDIATRFQKTLLSGLKKEDKEDLLKKYLCPKNVPLAKSPTLNPEISAMLAETCRLRDKRLLNKQEQIGKTLSALGQAITHLLKRNPDLPDVVRTLNDVGKLLADSHYVETETRRSVIIPLIDKSLADPFKDRKRDAFLFGENLGDLVKSSRGIKKTGEMIQASTSSAVNLNGKGSSSRGRNQRSGQIYRAGGPRPMTSYQNQHRPVAMRAPPPQRARWFPPHPSQPTRRQTPPPAAAARAQRVQRLPMKRSS